MDKYITPDPETRYFLTVDLYYPPEIKYKTRFFPLAPEKIKIPEEAYSNYQHFKKENRYPSEKLMFTQLNESQYQIHYREFQFYIRMGMKVTKIHNMISFKTKCVA